jgi:ApbE superfamily uncharacterized protein (UPF0280 family)
MSNKLKKAPQSYRQRKYRQIPVADGMRSCLVQVRETDLQIMAPVDVAEAATHLLIQERNRLENYISHHREFLDALQPLADDPTAPVLVREMLKAGLAAGVGPMAAVAGVIAEQVGTGLLERQDCDEVVVENGGDIFLQRQKDCTVAIYAGESPLSYRIGIRLPVAMMPSGVCTSSGTVGHSLSAGKADSVTVVASSTALADAAATSLGNVVGKGGDIGRALELAAEISGLSGVVIVVGEELGAWGEIELVETGETLS